MTIDLINLPASVKSALLADCTKKLQDARERKPDLLMQLALVDEEIKGYDSIVKALTTNNVELTPSKSKLAATDGKVTNNDGKYDGGYKDGAAYSRGWTHAQKIKYVTDRPEKYGFKTLQGSKGVVEAILQEEPEWLDEMPSGATGKKGTLIGKLAPIISRMVDTDNKQLIKLRTKGTKNDFHFVSADWFFDKDETRVRPEHAEAIADLEPVPSEKTLAPAGTGANNAKSETDGEKTSADASERQNGHSLGQLSFSGSN